MSMAYIREHYGVPAHRGARVLLGKEFGNKAGARGTVTSADGHYLRIRLDDEQHPRSFHPTWELEWLTSASNCDVCERELEYAAIDHEVEVDRLCPHCRLAGGEFARNWISSLLLAGEPIAEAAEILDIAHRVRAVA